MRSIARGVLVLMWAGVWSSVVLAQSPPSVSAPEAREPKVAIIGASVSAGFKDGPMFGGEAGNDTVPLQKVLGPRFEAMGGTVSSRADVMMFTDPTVIGERQVKSALRGKPDLLVAVDFLFWYSHGPLPRAEDEAKYRKARLDEGLGMLARFDCPILVGDLPDMRGAAARMLHPSWIPEPKLLAELNEQVQAWAKQRTNVRVFPLTAEVKALKETGVTLPLRDGPLKTGPGELLQGDRLHTTRLGMAWLGMRLDQELRSLLPKDHALAKDAKWTLEDWIEAAGAGPDLETARAKVKEKEPVPAGKGQ